MMAQIMSHGVASENLQVITPSQSFGKVRVSTHVSAGRGNPGFPTHGLNGLVTNLTLAMHGISKKVRSIRYGVVARYTSL